ncbi:PAS domain-containing sensor histidine kinase [Halohasta salina]|uniref:PAS domain-containing sensor histidine kinase n=1 Tax=Halohasta salina TaxID=2961621 RepID=UPI0020A2C3F9|nr:PAS domain-containing protein [Halohasta salina]
MPHDHANDILDHIQNKVVLLNTRGEYIYANATTQRLLGFDRSDLIGECAFEYIHPEDRPAVERSFARILADDSITEATAVYRNRTAEGDYIWLESQLSDVTTSDLDGYLVSSVDVTKRIEAETKHSNLSDRLQEIAQTTDEVIWMFAGDWSELLFINDAYERYYGSTVDQLRERPLTFLDRIHPEDRPRVEVAMERLSDGHPTEIEYRVDPDQNYHNQIWVRGQPIVKDGEVVRIVGVSRDVTERNRRERQLLVLDNLLRHNLRNDMNLITGAAALLEEEHPDSADRTGLIRNTASELLESADKGRRITEMVTDGPDRTRVDLRATIDECVDRIRETYPQATVSTDVPSDCTVLTIRQVDTAIMELLDNAISYSSCSTPHVTVTVSRTDGEVETEVYSNSDPLAGFEAAVLRGDHEMDDLYHSSGLGLWLVYWLAELSNGRTEIEQNTAEGVSIALTLPAALDA